MEFVPLNKMNKEKIMSIALAIFSIPFIGEIINILFTYGIHLGTLIRRVTTGIVC